MAELEKKSKQVNLGVKGGSLLRKVKGYMYLLDEDNTKDNEVVMEALNKLLEEKKAKFDASQ